MGNRETSTKNSARREPAKLVKTCVGYEGAIKYNSDYPDGTPRKLLDVGALSALGWTASIDLHAGIEATCDWYRKEGHVG